MYLLNYRTNNGLHTEMGYRVPVAGLVEERPCDRSDVNLAMQSVRGQRFSYHAGSTTSKRAAILLVPRITKQWGPQWYLVRAPSSGGGH